MSNMQKKPSLREQVLRLWESLITPHPSVDDLSEYRRAQLLSVFTLILTILFVGAIVSGPRSYSIFVVLGGITLVSYGLSRTKYYLAGIYIFTYAFTSIGYVTIYLGTANSIETAVTSTVHIALIFSSALLSPGGFLGLAALSTIATFTAPMYSNAPIVAGASIGRTGGIVLVINALLYGTIIFRRNLEKTQARELGNAQRELKDAKTGLDARIEKYVRELRNADQQLQNRVARLQVIAEISQNISDNTTRPLNEFLTVAATSISNKLGFYHVGIFLLDEYRQYAVLHATNSKGGMQMLARHHQLKVGGAGIVGYVSQSGYPRIALDTGADAVFFNNPDLPGTRSEMALPLKVGARTLGILDVQSTQSSAFDDEDLTTFSTLANQLAIAISNSQLREDENLITRTSQNSRQKIQFSHNDGEKGFSYLADGTLASPLSVDNASVEKAIKSGEAVVLDQSTRRNTVSSMAIPVKVRDEVIGIIHIESTDDTRKWTEDEVAMVQAVSDRAALALENARLFEETARRAEQERVVAEVTSRIGESNDLERILQTTIETLGRTLGTTRTFIQLDTPSFNLDARSNQDSG